MEEESHTKIQGKGAPGRENSMCKGPGIEMSLVCLRDRKKAKWLELGGLGEGDGR